jgi:internalin A
MLAGPVSRSWRRFLRFSLRGAIVLVLVIGAGLGWIVRSAHVQRDAVAAIRNARGSVIYDWQRKKTTLSLREKPKAPKWLVSLIGVDYFGHVIHVWLSPIETDAVIVQVGRLTPLESLSLSGSSVSDAGLAHLKGLTNLSVLELSGTHVTDAGLAHLKGLSTLSELQLDGTQVTDAGLKNLKGLTKLTHVVLDGDQITDAGVKELQQALPSLTIFLWPPANWNHAGDQSAESSNRGGGRREQGRRGRPIARRGVVRQPSQ